MQERGGHGVKTITENLPQFNTVSSFAFIKKTVYPVDRSALMIAS